MSKLPSPKQVRDSLVLASTEDLMAELMARCHVAVIVTLGMPDREAECQIAVKGNVPACKRIAAQAARNMELLFK